MNQTERVLALEGVLNFRDFGGYAAPGGAVRRGLLYRSAQFSEATPADREKLDALGVTALIDLRRPEERAASPNLWPSAGVRVVVDDEGPLELPPHVAVLLRTDLTAAHVAEFMHSTYRAYPTETRYLNLFRAFFAALLNENGPVVVHCAAGKDRTGLACALALGALKVDRDAIVADYEMTNTVVNLEQRLPEIRKRIEERLGRPVDPEALRPMLGVRADYLLAALDAIDAQGGLDAYLEGALGVGPDERARLAARLIG